MNQEIIQYIIQRIAEWLDNRQMIVLQNTLDESMKMTESRQKTKSSEELLTEFIAAKRLEGRSEGTLAVYKNSIGQLLGYTDRNVCVMTTEDIRNCLNRYQEEHGTSRVSLDNIRRNLSSFFKWLEDENHIFKSPVRRIHKIKTTLVVREQSNIHHVHPHKFRRTMATAAIDKGMPIEQIQRLLGHEQIDTTLHYAMVKQSNVKSAHRKYIG